MVANPFLFLIYLVDNFLELYLDVSKLLFCSIYYVLLTALKWSESIEWCTLSNPQNGTLDINEPCTIYMDAVYCE